MRNIDCLGLLLAALLWAAPASTVLADEPEDAAAAPVQNEAADAQDAAGAAANDEPADSPAADGEPADEIVFQFEGIPYNEVLRRFAQMAERPLIGEQPIEGTLTFFDAEPYNYEDGLDTLNVILSMKGYTLVESGRFLRLVKLEDMNQLPLRVLRGMDEVDDIRPSEVATVVLSLSNLDASEVAQAVRPMLTTAGSIATVTQGRGVIITDRASTLRRVQTLIERMDEESPAERQMQATALAHASGAVVTDLINKTFGEESAPRRTVWNEKRNQFDELSPNPEDYITAVWDEPSRTLVMFGPGERLKLATSLIERFEREGSGASEVKIYYPRSLSANELGRIIREAVPGVAPQRGRASATDARIIVDNDTNRLIVAAPTAGQLESIDSLIRQLDEDVDDDGKVSEAVLVTRVFRLRHGNADNVTRIVQDATSQRSARGEEVQRLRINHDAATSNLVVTGPPALVQTAGDLIEKLESESQPQPRQMRIFRLTEVEPADIAESVRQLADERLRGQRPSGQTEPHLLPDANNRRLIVTATEAELTVIAQIIEELDREPARSQRELHVIRLDGQDAEQVLPLVQRLFREQAGDRGDTPEFIADGRRLIVLANDADVEQIQTLIDRLGEQPGDDAAGSQRELRAVDAGDRDVAELHPMVQQLYEEQTRDDRETRAGRAVILADERSNRLLVTGTEAQIEHVERIVAELATPEGQIDANETRIYRLETASAEELAGLVRSAMENRRGEAPVRVLVDRTSNSLVVSGPAVDVETAGKIIGQLDAAPQRGRQELRVVGLESAQANDVAPLLRQLLTQQMRDDHGERYDLRAEITTDERANRLIVHAPAEEWERIDAILAQLDKPAEQADNSRVFKLEHGEATDLVPVLERAMRRRDQWNRIITTVSIAADRDSNSLIVTGEREDVQAVARIVEDIDRPTDREPREMRQVEVSADRARELVAAAQRVWNERHPDQRDGDRVNISVAPSGDRLLLIGPDSQLDAMAELVDELKGDAEPARQLHSLDVPAGQAQQSAQLLTGLLREELGSRAAEQVTVMAHPNGRRLLVLAGEAHLERVRELLETLSGGESTDGRERQIFEFTDADELARLRPMVEQLYRETIRDWPDGQAAEARFVVDEQRSRFVVTAAPEHLAEIERIIEELATGDGPDERERHTRVYELEGAQARPLSDTVNRLFREQVRSRPGLIESTLILPDEATNRLIVSGPEAAQTIVQELVGQLDDADAESADARLFQLKHADANRAAAVISNAVADRTSWGAVRTRVNVGADSATGTLVVSGEPGDMRVVARIIEQLDTVEPTEPRQMRVFDLAGPNAAETGRQVTRLYEEQVRSASEQAEADAVIMPDARTRRLIVMASEPHLAMIETIVAALDDEAGVVGRQMRVLSLENASATAVASVVSQMFPLERGADEAARLSVSAAGDDRTLVVEAPTDTLERVEELVASLDAEPQAEPFEVRSYRLPQANVDGLVDTLSRLFQEQHGRPGQPGPRFAADSATNHLFVAALPRQFRQVQELLETVQETAEVTTQTRTFRLERGDAREVSQLLETMLRDRRAAPSRPRPRWAAPEPDEAGVRVAPAAALNAVVVQGTPEQLALAAEVIESLDSDDAKGRTVIRTVRLKQAEAGSMSDAVARVIRDSRAENELTRVNVTAEPNSNSLLLHGPTDEVEAVAEIVRDLDTESEQRGIDVRIYQLDNGEARELSDTLGRMLDDLIRQRPGARSGDAPPMSITADTRTNSLIVSTTPAYFAIVEQMLAQLDRVPERPEREVELVQLEHAEVFSVASRLRQVFLDRPSAERPIIESDTYTNTLTLIASREDLRTIEPIIRQLDEGAAGDSVRVRVLSTAPVPANQMADMLIEVYQPLTDRRLEVVDRVDGPQPRLPRSRGLAPNQNDPAEALDDAVAPNPLGDMGDDLAVDDDVIAPPDAAAQAIEDAEGDEPFIAIVVDSFTNSLIVSASRRELQDISAMVRELSYAFILGEDEFRTYRLEQAEPGATAEMLRELFDPRAEERRHRAQAGGRGNDNDDEENGDENRQAPLPPPNISVVAEPRTRSVIVRAKPMDFVKIEAMIERLDAEPAFPEAEVAMFTLRRAEAARLAQVLREMLQPSSEGQVTDEARALQEQVRLLRVRDDQGEAVELDLTEPIKIMADPLEPGQRGGNRLIVSSTPANLLAIEAVVDMMDRLPVSDELKVQFVRVRHADAEVVADTLRDMFEQGESLIRGPIDGAEPENISGQALAHPLHVAVDARTNTLVLSGREESVALAHLVVSDLDREHDRFVTDVRLFRLEHASAARLAPLLLSVFTESAPTDGTAGVRRQVTRLRTALPELDVQATELVAERPPLTIQPDESTNLLVVAARADMMPLIADVIDTMDIPGAAGLQAVRIYPLDHAEAARLRDVIQNLYSGPGAGTVEASRRPTVTVDSRTNALVVSGDDAAVEAIETLIERLDTEVAVGLRDIQVLRLEHADAGPLAGVIQQMMDARVERGRATDELAAERLRVIVLGDARTNSLLIGGTRESFELVESLAAELDQAGPAISGQIRVMPLEHATAATLAGTLTNLFNERYQAAQTADVQRRRPIIMPDMRTNSLLVAADVEDNEALEALVEQLDSEAAVQAADVRLYALEHASAVQLAPTLQQFFAAKRTAELTVQTELPIMPLQVHADARTNTLMVSGGRDHFAQVEDMIDRLDVAETTQAGQYRLFVLEQTRATEMQETLEQLFASRPPRQPGQAVSPISIVADNRSNTLVVGAVNEDMPMVASLIERLDQVKGDAGVSVHVLPVTKADARRIAETVEGLYRSERPDATPISVSVDERLNALVVSATDAESERLRKLVRQLDTAAVSRVAELRVFQLKHAEAPALADLLTETLTTAPDSPNASASLERQTLLQFVTRSRDGQDLVASALQEGVLITSDRRTNSLLISAPVDNMPFLEQLVEAMDAASPQMAQIRIFTLTNADANQMAEILSSLFRLQATGGGNNDRSVNYTLVMAGREASDEAAEGDGDAAAEGGAAVADAGDNEPASATMGSAERHALTVTVDVRTNSLLVGGTEHYVQLASRLIEELDAAPAQERQTRAYRLRNAQTEDVETALRSFLDQERQRLVSTLGPDAVGAAHRLLEREVAIIGEPSTSTLLVSASPRYFDTVMGLLEELDQPQPQVLIQVLLAEVTLDGSTELGIEWSFESAINSATAVTGTDFGVAGALARAGGFSTSVTGGDVDFLLRALQEDGRLEVLSRPQVLAADNQMARINIGQSVPLLTGSQVTEQGTTTTQVAYRDIGVILEVTPRISPDGFVKLDVLPEISALSLSDIELQPGIRAPIINQRTAETTVSVQNGQTIMIGGLISTRDNERESKVPLLGDIPLLGPLFRSTIANKERTELLIILTPHILRNVADARAMTARAVGASNAFDGMKHNDAMEDSRFDSMLQPLRPPLPDGDALDGSDADDGSESPAPDATAPGESFILPERPDTSELSTSP